MPSRLTGFVCPTVSMVTTGHATGVEKTLLRTTSKDGRHRGPGTSPQPALHAERRWPASTRYRRPLAPSNSFRSPGESPLRHDGINAEGNKRLNETGYCPSGHASADPATCGAIGLAHVCRWPAQGTGLL